MFIDASAIVAVLSAEPRAGEIREAFDEALAARLPLRSSVLARMEAILSLAGKIARDAPFPPGAIHDATKAVDALIAGLGVEVEPITSELVDRALAAATLYHKRAGHPARLNFGDCLAYACAQSHGEPLLFVGADFIHTDARSVLANPDPRRN